MELCFSRASLGFLSRQPLFAWLRCLLPALLASGALAAVPDYSPPGFPDIQLGARMRGAAAVNALGAHLPAVAAFYHVSPGELRRRLQDDSMLWLDERGRLLFVCEFPPLPPAGSNAAIRPLANSPAGFPYEQTFRLHSRPGASKVIYLDFDGHDASTTIWGTQAIARPFDFDSNPSTFSNAERDRIQYIWQRVSEDYAHLDVDVTTEDPGVEALRKSNAGDNNYGIRAVIGGNSTDWYGNAGGVAYVGSFNWNSDTPCWIFPKGLGPDNEKYIAEAISHEVGHTLGLIHDGTTAGVAYYQGQGNWAPIMGVGYYVPIVQWSKGEYANANNTEDDIAIMLSYGVNFRADDHGNSLAAATALLGPVLSSSGVIGSQTDMDYFSFATGAGRVSLTATPSARSPNLHILLNLYDSTGALLVSTTTADTAAGTQPVTISTNLPAGTYFAAIDGLGEGSPTVTGYSDYSSLGQYTIAGSLPSDSAWLPTAGGTYSWTNLANWASNTVPLGAGVMARFANNLVGDQFITLDQPLTVGGLLVGDADGSHTFNFMAGGGPLAFLSATGLASLAKSGAARDTLAVPLVLQTSLLVTNNTAGELSLGGVVSGAGGLTKLGSGRLLLETANTFAGDAVIAGGTLALGDAGAVAAPLLDVKSGAVFDVSAVPGGFTVSSNQTLGGAGTVLGGVVVANGAALAPGGSSAPGTLTFSNQLTLTAGARLKFDLAATVTPGGGTNDLIIVTGDLALNGPVAVDFNFLAGTPVSPGNYRLLQYGGALTSGASNLLATPAGNRFLYTFDDSVPGEISMLVSGSPTNLLWLGDGAQNRWEIAGAVNWLNGVSPDAFAQLDMVSFDDSGSASPSVNLIGALQPASVTVDASNNFSFAGAGKLSGGAALIKNGTGTLTLNNANDFSGTVMVNGGTLKLANARGLGATNAGTFIAAGSMLDLNAQNLGAEPVSVAGVITNSSSTAQTNALRFLTLTGNAALGGSGRWDVRANPTASVSGNGFTLTKTGPSELWLADLGATGLGDIAVQQGLLGIADSTTLGDAAKALMLSPGTTVAFNNTDINTLSKKLFLTNATLRSDAGNNLFIGTIGLSGSNVVDVAAGLSLQGIISNTGDLTKVGSGILTLSAANSFGGTLRVNAGTLRVRNSAALGDVVGGTLINAGARLDLNGISLGAEPLTVLGTGLGTVGAIVNDGAAQNNALRFVTLTGNTTFGGLGRWDVRANPTASFTGNNFALTKVSSNEVWLVDVGSSGLGNITVNVGLFGVQGNTTLGNAASTLAVNSSHFAISGTGTNALNKVLTLSSSRVYNSSGSNFFVGPTTLTGSNAFDIPAPGALTMSNVISGAGSLHAISGGTLVLAANNTYSGATRIAAGPLQVGNGLGAGSPGTGNITNNATLIFNRSNDFTVANFITGSGALTKLGAGALTLSGANNYAGASTVAVGTLKAGSATALGVTNNGTTVSSGATLDLNGFNLGAEMIMVNGSGVGGNGALLNSGATQSNALRYVVLTSPTTIGGANRWDLRDPGAGGASSLSGAFTLTKVGGNQIWLGNLGATSLEGIAINGGSLVVQGTTTFGNPAATLSVSNGCLLGIVGTGANVLAKVLAVTNATVWNGGGSNALTGLKVLSGAVTFDVSSGATLVLDGIVDGAGDLVKTNPGVVLLTANNSYSGNTVIAGGTFALGSAASVAASPVIQVNAGSVFDVSAVGGGFVLAPAQTLRGNGTVNGSVTANGIVSPGASIGRLTFNQSLALGGTLAVELSKTGPTRTNDALVVAGTLTLGGALNVMHSGDPLANGDTFQLLYAGTILGGFATNNLPSLTSGLHWDVSALATTGVLRVGLLPPPTILPAACIGTNLVLQLSSEAGVTYVLEAAASLDTPVIWSGIATNLGTGGLLTFPVAVDFNQTNRFFRVLAY